MNLLRDKEYDEIQRALDQKRTITMIRELGSYRIVVETLPAPDIWLAPMLIRVQQWRRKDENGFWLQHMYSTQNFKDTAQMRRILATEKEML